MGDPNNNQGLNNNYQYLHQSVGSSSHPSSGISGGGADVSSNNAVYKPVPPPKPLSSPPTYRMPPPPTGAALYTDPPPIPGATCTNYELQSQHNLRTHSSKFPVSENGQGMDTPENLGRHCHGLSSLNIISYESIPLFKGSGFFIMLTNCQETRKEQRVENGKSALCDCHNVLTNVGPIQMKNKLWVSRGNFGQQQKTMRCVVHKDNNVNLLT